MVQQTQSTEAISNAQETVYAFIKAMNSFDYAKARTFVNDDMSFVGVMGSREGADIYFNDMQHMKFQYDIKKAFSDETDVCLFYDINMSGIVIFSCGWYHLKEGKIQTIRVLFDPRPLLEKQK